MSLEQLYEPEELTLLATLRAALGAALAPGLVGQALAGCELSLALDALAATRRHDPIQAKLVELRAGMALERARRMLWRGDSSGLSAPRLEALAPLLLGAPDAPALFARALELAPLDAALAALWGQLALDGLTRHFLFSSPAAAREVVQVAMRGVLAHQEAGHQDATLQALTRAILAHPEPTLMSLAVAAAQAPLTAWQTRVERALGRAAPAGQDDDFDEASMEALWRAARARQARERQDVLQGVPTLLAWGGQALAREAALKGALSWVEGAPAGALTMDADAVWPTGQLSVAPDQAQGPGPEDAPEDAP